MRTLCLTGIDGAGKSTQIAALADALGQRGLTVRAVSIWDGLTSPDVSDTLGLRTREQVYRYLQVLTPVSRTYFLFHALRLSLDIAASTQCDTLLLDGYWYKYYATEVADGADRHMLRSMAAAFPEPDQTFYLKVSAPAAAARKSEITAYERGFGNPELFTERQRESRQTLDGLAAELGWRVLDGSQTPDQITRNLLADLAPEVHNHDW